MDGVARGAVLDSIYCTTSSGLLVLYVRPSSSSLGCFVRNESGRMMSSSWIVRDIDPSRNVRARPYRVDVIGGKMVMMI